MYETYEGMGCNELRVSPQELCGGRSHKLYKLNIMALQDRNRNSSNKTSAKGKKKEKPRARDSYKYENQISKSDGKFDDESDEDES